MSQTDNSATTEAPQVVKVFAGNLPFSTTDESLKELFSTVAEIVDAHVVTTRNRSMGFGFVDFSTLENAEKAIKELDKHSLDGRTIVVELAKVREDNGEPRRSRGRGSRRGRGRGPRRGEEGAEEAFEGEEGGADREGESRRRRRGGGSGGVRGAGRRRRPADGEGSGSGEGSGDFQGEQQSGEGPRRGAPRRRPRYNRDAGEGEQAGEGEGEERRERRGPSRRRRRDDADEEHQEPAEGGDLEDGEPRRQGFGRRGGGPRRRGPRRPARRPRDENQTPSETTVFVANIPFAMEEEDLMNLFKDFSPQKAQVARFRQRSKGFGFVQLASKEQQEKAVAALDNTEADGRQLTVKVAMVDLSAPPRQAESQEEEQPAQSE